MLNGSDRGADINSRRASEASQFRARVALEAVKGIRTINDISKENDMPPTQISAWKKELESRVDEIFEGISGPRYQADDEKIMRQIDLIHTDCPLLGARKIVLELRDVGWRIGRRRCRRLMRITSIEAMVPKPSLSKPAPGNKIYPYLLRELEVNRPDQVWCTDI